MAKKTSGKKPVTVRGARTRGPSIDGSTRQKPQRNELYTRGSRIKPRKKKKSGVRRVLARSLASIGFTLLILGGAALLYAMQGLPDIRTLNTAKKERGITFESEDGKVIATYGDVTGRYIEFANIPKPLIQAVLATEDRRFFSHMGIDVWGIIRAASVNALAGKVVQGGSTITQQLAKNVFLTPERSLMRKVQEALLALALEARYSKEEIITIYLNRVYMGSGVFGMDAAAKRYFNKGGTELNLSESAMLAGLLKAPSRYAPTNSKSRAVARADQVLVNMHDAGMLNDAELARARSTLKSTAIVKTLEGGDARYFTDWVMEELPGLVGAVDEDMIVTTTLQPSLQRAAEDAVQTIIATKGSSLKASQGALVSMSPDGAVRAMVGGVNYFKAPYNRAVQAQRQPGSAFKFFVYLAALEAGLSPDSLVEDGPVSMTVAGKDWSPENYGKSYQGEVTLASAMRQSLNTVAVRLALYAGINRVAETAMRLGISRVPNHPSIALGSKETSLLRMTTAYAHMPSYGYSVVPYGIVSIRTPKGKKLFTYEGTPARKLIAGDVVEMMNYMMMGVVRAGTATKAALPGRDAAGKTGTSQNFKDAWFVGYTSQLATGVWVGNDNNQPMLKVTGGSLPAQIWHDYMMKASAEMPNEPLPSRATGGGFLPWLFGADSVSDASIADRQQQGLPDQVPFEVKDEHGQVVEPERLPVVIDGADENQPAPEPRAKPRNPRKVSEDGLLPQGFLDDLVNSLPSGEVKYEYPSDTR